MGKASPFCLRSAKDGNCLDKQQKRVNLYRKVSPSLRKMRDVRSRNCSKTDRHSSDKAGSAGKVHPQAISVQSRDPMSFFHGSGLPKAGLPECNQINHLNKLLNFRLCSVLSSVTMM